MLGEGELCGGAPRHRSQISAVIVGAQVRHGKSEQTPAPGSIEMKPQRAQVAAEHAGRRPIQPATAHLTALIAIRLNTKKLYTAPADQSSVCDSI